MERAVYIAMTAAKSIEQAQAVRANNMANANTGGFRADFARARSVALESADSYNSRAYALTDTPATDFTQGTLSETGRELDLAIAGEGWMAVQAPDGTEAYTRAGSLRVDALGRVTTASGLPVMGNGGPIALPPAQKIELGLDGTITVQPKGQGAETIAQVDRIKFVNPDPKTLVKGADGLMHYQGEQADVPADASIRVQTGFLEGSNVNAVREMTEIISLSRQFEMQIKMMSTAADNVSAAARLVRMS